MKKEFKLGKDLMTKDNLLDGFTFEDVIDALNCNEPIINEAAVKKVVNEMLGENIRNFHALLRCNLEEIMKRAKAGK